MIGVTPQEHTNHGVTIVTFTVMNITYWFLRTWTLYRYGKGSFSVLTGFYQSDKKYLRFLNEKAT